MGTDALIGAPRLSMGAAARLRAHLEALYPPAVAADTHARLARLLEGFVARHGHATPPRRDAFDHTDVMLITYGDQVTEPGRAPLRTLDRFLRTHVGGIVTGLHLLPHYPSTSDDGFAVADYGRVDPALGEWGDVERLSGDFRLMLDAVVNHTSASNPWFRGWLDGDERFADFYLCLDPDTSTNGVTRPRASPLLHRFEGIEGPRWVWTTFSADQVDLNYANPEVLLAVCDVLLHYVERGASVLRLDAIGFLWKELDTSCIHLPQTHEVVRLWRTMFDAVAPGTVLITETNVPHAENVSYFGSGDDEAHLVYQFPLAPLTLSAFHNGDSSVLQRWLATLSTPSPGTAFLNFLGCHDGIGLRPAEGLLAAEEIARLCAITEAHGGGVSYRANPDGTVSPYELNTVYFDALNPVGSTQPMALQIERFIAAQSILLALAGVPAVYFHALFGSRNWTDGVIRTGRLRSINREKFDRAELEAELADPGSLRHRVLTRMRERIRVRITEPAFHPSAEQRVVRCDPALLAFQRTALDGTSRVLCVSNLNADARVLHVGPEDGLELRGESVDLCDGSEHRTDPRGVLRVEVPPYGVRWLRQGP